VDYGSDSGTGYLNYDDDFTFGEWSGGYFDGKMDEVAIYSEALSAADILELYGMSQSRFQSGQMAYWPLDFDGVADDTYDWISHLSYECAGVPADSCVFDHSKNANTGRLGNGFAANEPVWTEDCRFDNNPCLDFVSDDNLALSGCAGCTQVSSMTFSAWVLPRTGTGGALVREFDWTSGYHAW